MTDALRRCEKCNEVKPLQFYYSESSTICNYCRDEKFRVKKKKFMAIDMNIRELKPKLGFVSIIKNDAKSSRKIPYRAALKLIEEGLAKVIYPDMIYDLVDNESLLLDANYTCHYCGGYGDTIDHVVPTSKGGADVIENKVCSCEECNQLKSDMDYKNFKSIFDENGHKLGKRIARERYGTKGKTKGVTKDISGNKELKRLPTKEEKLDNLIDAAFKKSKW
ncbi:HNH endonuclease [Paenibacillus amylolyticus]|uniref:HNH endonuclease n=1 Tax=Paenibacillus amylolyticus TaxID=1451 RepID=UPI00211B66A5|nr:HNH endonuclease [Paenibacillus amylolyticus]